MLSWLNVAAQGGCYCCWKDDGEWRKSKILASTKIVNEAAALLEFTGGPHGKT